MSTLMVKPQNNMKKLLIALIILLIIIITVLIGGGIYAYLKLKPFFISSSSINTNQEVVNTNQTPTDKNPLLTPSQEATLEKIGIDPAKLPTTITPAMEDCFVQTLGADRVNAIKSGASPTTIDLFKAKSCI